MGLNVHVEKVAQVLRCQSNVIIYISVDDLCAIIGILV